MTKPSSPTPARVRTRFAPSPTGFIHLGNIRSALYPWAFARAKGGDFVLRIEDTDLERSTQESVDIILQGMDWVGLHADNCSNIVYQSKNFPRYKALIQQLLDEGHAYHCYCSKEELEEMREKAEREGTATYDRRWRPEVLEVTIERPARSLATDADLDAAAERLAEVASGRPDPAPAARALNVADVLELTVAEAAQLFAQDRDVIRALQPLMDVGLDYVKLGQPVPTLSGGEAQRLKLAGHLAEAAQTASRSRQPVAKKGTLFLFDEPTSGLHFDDIAKLMRALRKLLQAGHSIIVIEHNLDVIKTADWIVDLGPEGGSGGGEIIASGTPEQVAENPASYTGQFLKPLLKA